MSLYPKMEIKLNWPDIFERVIIEKRGGICYERNEVLYQALAKFGYTVYRIECAYADRLDRVYLITSDFRETFWCYKKIGVNKIC